MTPARPATADAQSKLATLARLLNPGAASAFRSSYTGDVANDLPGGKPMTRSPTRQQLALILAGSPSTAAPSTATGSGSGSGGTVTPPMEPIATPPANHGGSGPGGLGNAGGASQPGNAGAAGDSAGHPGFGGFSSATPSDVASRASTGAASGANAANLASDRGGWSNGSWSPVDENGLIDISGVGSAVLGTATALAPGWAGAALSVAQMVARGYNVAQINDIRRKQGLPELDAGQIAGGVIGANGYGGLGGNTTVANPEQFTPAINTHIGDLYNNNPNFFGKPSLYGPNSLAETSNGQDYQEGPGGILGWLGRQVGVLDGPKPAWSIRNTNAFLGGPGSMGSIATGAAGARGVKGGNSGFGTPNADVGFGAGNYASTTGAPSGPAITSGGPSSGAGRLTISKQHPGQYSDGSLIPAGMPGSMVGAGGGYGGGPGGSPNAGQSMGNTSNASGLGNAAGAGIGGVSGHDTTAVGSSGQLGHIATGGWIPGNAAREGDNHLMATTPGEFVVRRGQAQRFAPLLQAINSGSIVPPRGARVPAMAF